MDGAQTLTVYFRRFPWGFPHAMAGSNEPGVFSGTWLTNGQLEQFFEQPYYAISSPITVVPEPTTVTLLFPALLGLGLVYLRWRGAKA